MLGFTAPAVLGMASAGWSSREAIPTMVAAGAMEGLVLGTAQAHALAPALPGLRSGPFAVGTALAAAVAYLLGMLPSALGSGLVEAPRAFVVLVCLVGGIVLLGSIGTAQWLELRRHVDKASSWIATTAAAWLAGLIAFLLIAMPLWQPGQRPVVVVAISLVSAGAMATTVSVVTGLGMQRLLKRRLLEPSQPFNGHQAFGPAGVPRAAGYKSPNGTQPVEGAPPVHRTKCP
jgi:hypothetical protein